MIPPTQVAELRFSPAAQDRFSGVRSAQSDALHETILTRPVLIVEDEAVIAWTLESLLEDMGFKQIAIAASGVDAIEAAKRSAPGLIISDINLGAGEMDGVTAAAAIVAATETAVVFITAYANADARQRIERSVPVATLLRKPANATELRRAIAEITSRGSTN